MGRSSRVAVRERAHVVLFALVLLFFMFLFVMLLVVVLVVLERTVWDLVVVQI